MNLRINGQELRFRVTKEELESLCSGKTLEQSTLLPNNQVLTSTIASNSSNDGMSLSNDSNALALLINKSLATKFFESLPSREGLEATQEINDELSLTLILEVDIRTQKRKKSEEKG